MQANGRINDIRVSQMFQITSCRENGAGAAMASLCVAKATKTAGIQKSVSDAKRLKALEGEDRRLKSPLADALLDISMLKDAASQKW